MHYIMGKGYSAWGEKVMFHSPGGFNFILVELAVGCCNELGSIIYN